MHQCALADSSWLNNVDAPRNKTECHVNDFAPDTLERIERQWDEIAMDKIAR